MRAISRLATVRSSSPVVVKVVLGMILIYCMVLMSVLRLVIHRLPAQQPCGRQANPTAQEHAAAVPASLTAGALKQKQAPPTQLPTAAKIGSSPPAAAAAAVQQPLAPWVLPSSAPRSAGTAEAAAPVCVVLHVGDYGLGSSLNFVILSTVLLLQQHPNTTVFLDAHPFASICAEGLQELLMPVTPVTRTPAPAACDSWNHGRMVSFVRSFTSKAWVRHVGFDNGAAFFHQASQLEMPLQARVRHKLLWDAVWLAMCPVMRNFWRLSPAAQQRISEATAGFRQPKAGSHQQPKMVALHIRGGDKLSPGTREVPTSFDYSFDRGITAVATRLAAEAAAAATGAASTNMTLPHCILMGDDAQLTGSVQRKLASVLQCDKLVVRPPSGSVRPFQRGATPTKERCENLQTMLVELDLLASADYTVGTMWSNYNSIAFYAALCVYNRSADTYIDGSAAVYGPYV